MRQQEEQKRLEDEIQQQKDLKEEQRLEELRLAEQRREEELFETGGIQYFEKLRVIPDSRIDDKVILPQSAFELLEKQRVFDESKVLTFRLQIHNDGSSNNPNAGMSISNPATDSPATKFMRTTNSPDSSSPPDLLNASGTSASPTSFSSPTMRASMGTTGSNSNGPKVTHCGVAEFTAEEGTIRFGPKVLFSL